ncbi:hypothetical protein MKW94_009631 [Papaver nudicaule]|uniref:Leucine-rich repeat-containing N-terminal plant-type domain-containing protein n=1 Tax=Papaver nudicaule TaxID=74823 RepID=A0AA41VJJ2_PAPNU|nr:hypothetical protein [Papaver nudicaule]
MRSHLGALLFFIWSLSNSVNNNWVQGNCLDDQRALLLQLNQSQFFRGSSSSKRSSWHLNTDCCSSWEGIACDRAGHVIGLDLSNEGMYDELINSSSLFKLRYLERLNLAGSSFGLVPIPSELGQLTNLQYLNLSSSGFAGKIPIEISRLTRLVTLDISGRSRFRYFYLTHSDLETLIHNLTELRELVLDGVSISGQANKWCRTLSSSLPKLQVLSLSDCELSGPFDSSLSKLRSLSVLRLDGNNISAEVPQFFSKFHNLTTLHLSNCQLQGKFPERVLQLPTLDSLDLSGNDRLQGSLPEFPKVALLHELDLSDTSFTGKLPNSIGNLRHLSRLDLSNCQFYGSIPSSFSKLSQLEYLDLSNNSFTGSITSIINSSKKLVYIDLSDNHFTGPIPSEWNEFKMLT